MKFYKIMTHSVRLMKAMHVFSFHGVQRCTHPVGYISGNGA